MAHEDLITWIKDVRAKGYTDQQIIANLKKAGHRDDAISRALQDAPIPKRQPRSNKYLIPPILLVILLIGAGLFVILREGVPPSGPATPQQPSPFLSYYAFENADSKDAEPERVAAAERAALQVKQEMEEICPVWEECEGELVGSYIGIQLKLGLSAEEILADGTLRQDLLYRKDVVKKWMEDYLASGNTTIFALDFSEGFFTLETLNMLNLLTDEEREQWIVELARISAPPPEAAVRRGDIIESLANTLGYRSFEELRPLYGIDYIGAYMSVCNPISMQEIEPASGCMIEYLYLRAFCNLPLSAEEVAALEQTLDSFGTDERSEYLKTHLRGFI